MTELELTFTRFLVYFVAGALYGGSVSFAMFGPDANAIVLGVFFGIIFWVLFIELEARH